MLRSVEKLEGSAIGATDGAIGKVKDFYFDDEAWVIRYVVVDTSRWLGGREVLISPYSLGDMDRVDETLPVTLTKEQIKNSPNVNSDEPISRQYEKSYLGYYGYPYYWSGGGLWGEGNYPGTLLSGMGPDLNASYRGYLRAPTSRDTDADPHLRSCQAVKGYHIRAKDGDIGHVQGFLVDDSTWSIRYLIVNTSNWWAGHQILLSPEWIQDVSWVESNVMIDLDRATIRSAPTYDPNVSLEREAEGTMYGHYGRQSYWGDPVGRAAA